MVRRFHRADGVGSRANGRIAVFTVNAGFVLEVGMDQLAVATGEGRFEARPLIVGERPPEDGEITDDLQAGLAGQKENER
jgi:hypothetical protein